MCRAGFADAIQIIAVLATIGLLLMENLLKIPDIHVVWHCFFNKLNAQTCKNLLKYQKGDIRGCLNSETHTVVIRKMGSAGLYSTTWYGLYFEQYIDIINCITKHTM